MFELRVGGGAVQGLHKNSKPALRSPQPFITKRPVRLVNAWREREPLPPSGTPPPVTHRVDVEIHQGPSQQPEPQSVGQSNGHTETVYRREGYGFEQSNGTTHVSQGNYRDLDKEPASPGPQSATQGEGQNYSKEFIARRLLVFSGILLGYVGLYFTRGSLTYTAPVMLSDKSLGLTMTDVGAMTSAFPLAYGLSKFTGGVLGAKFSSRLMLGVGLCATAAINIVFGLSASVTAWTALWFLNGSLQGIGAPASASLLTRWYASKERGTWWGLWNIGANIGGFLTPIIVGNVAKHYGWHWGMWLPGALGLSLGLFSLAVIKDSPEQAGFPSVERVPDKQGAKAGAAAATDGAKDKASAAGAEGLQGKPSIKEALVQVLKTPGTWLLAFTYFFVYIVRQGATSWMMFYLIQNKGAVDTAQAAMTVSGMELGGLVGGTLAGFLSDMRIRQATGPKAGHVGRRVQVVMAYVATTFAVLLALRATPPDAKWLQWLAIAGLGACIYGPHMLIGLCGAELVDKPAVGASQGVLGLVAYLGAANAGIPLSHVVQKFGWDAYFVAMAGACTMALLLLAPLFNAKSYLQRKAELAPAKAD